MDERRTHEDERPPTVAIQAFKNLTPQQRGVLFYWALGLISVPALGLLLIFILEIEVTWKLIVVFCLPMVSGFFVLSPGMTAKILDLVLRGIAGIIPSLGKVIRPERRTSQ